MIPPPVLLIRASALLQPSSHLPAFFEVVTTTMLDPKHSRRRQQHALPAQPTCYSETATDIGCHQKNQSRIPLVSHTTTARQWGGQVKSRGLLRDFPDNCMLSEEHFARQRPKNASHQCGCDSAPHFPLAWNAGVILQAATRTEVL